jgi:hypothetical protein
LPAKYEAGRASISVAPPFSTSFSTSPASIRIRSLNVAVKIFGLGVLSPVSVGLLASAVQA